MGPSKKLKQIIQSEHNVVKKPNWPEANQLALYKECRILFSLITNCAKYWRDCDRARQNISILNTRFKNIMVLLIENNAPIFVTCSIKCIVGVRGFLFQLADWLLTGLLFTNINFNYIREKAESPTKEVKRRWEFLFRFNFLNIYKPTAVCYHVILGLASVLCTQALVTLLAFRSAHGYVSPVLVETKRSKSHKQKRRFLKRENFKEKRRTVKLGSS